MPETSLLQSFMAWLLIGANGSACLHVLADPRQ